LFPGNKAWKGSCFWKCTARNKLLVESWKGASQNWGKTTKSRSQTNPWDFKAFKAFSCNCEFHKWYW